MNIEKGFSYPDETTTLSLIPPLVLGSATILVLTCLVIGVHCCYQSHMHSCRRRSRKIYTRKTNHPTSRIVPYSTHQYPVDTGKYSDIVIKTPKVHTKTTGMTTASSRISRNLDSFKSTLTRPVVQAASRGSPKPGLKISKSFEYAARDDKASASFINDEQADNTDTVQANQHQYQPQDGQDGRNLTSKNNDLSFQSILSFHSQQQKSTGAANQQQQQQTEINTNSKDHHRGGDNSKTITTTINQNNTADDTEDTEAFTSLSSDDQRTLAYQSEPSFNSNNHQHLSLSLSSAPDPRKSVPNVSNSTTAVEYSEIEKQRPPPKKAPRSGNKTAAAQATFQPSQHSHSAVACSTERHYRLSDGNSASPTPAASTFVTYAEKGEKTTSDNKTTAEKTDDFRVVQTSSIHPFSFTSAKLHDENRAQAPSVIKQKTQSSQKQPQQSCLTATAQKYSNSLSSLTHRHQPDKSGFQSTINNTTYKSITDTVQSPSSRSLNKAQFKNTKNAQQQQQIHPYESEGTVEVYNIATGTSSSIRVKDIRRKQQREQEQEGQQQQEGGEAAATEETSDENKIIGEIIYKEIKKTINTSQLKTDV